MGVEEGGPTEQDSQPSKKERRKKYRNEVVKIMVTTSAGVFVGTTTRKEISDFLDKDSVDKIILKAMPDSEFSEHVVNFNEHAAISYFK